MRMATTWKGSRFKSRVTSREFFFLVFFFCFALPCLLFYHHHHCQPRVYLSLLVFRFRHTGISKQIFNVLWHSLAASLCCSLCDEMMMMMMLMRMMTDHVSGMRRCHSLISYLISLIIVGFFNMMTRRNSIHQLLLLLQDQTSSAKEMLSSSHLVVSLSVSDLTWIWDWHLLFSSCFKLSCVSKEGRFSIMDTTLDFSPYRQDGKLVSWWSKPLSFWIWRADDKFKRSMDSYV